MEQPKVPEHGPRRWLGFARAMVNWIETIRPVAGPGLSAREIKGGGTQISLSGDQDTGGASRVVRIIVGGVPRNVRITKAELLPEEDA
jgi:hypothetical protein